MKESIMSFFNAPVTNKVPAGVCSVAGLHSYISSDSHLKELTQRVRPIRKMIKPSAEKNKHCCHTSRLPEFFHTVGSNVSYYPQGYL